jgi:tetratricopeptide (TPR) repeat protein/predicted nucleic acid-binding protein
MLPDADTLVLIPAAVNFFTAALQQFVVETADRQNALIDRNKSDIENARGLLARVNGQIAAKLRASALDENDLQPLQSLFSDDVLAREIVRELIEGKLTAELLAPRLIRYQPALIDTPKLKSLSEFFVNSFKLAIAEDSTIANAVTHRRLETAQATLDDIRNLDLAGINSVHQALANQAQSQAQSNEQLFGAVQQILQKLNSPRAANSSGLSTVMASPDLTPLNAVNKRRFDRARTELETGSVIKAEHEFLTLVEDLEVDGSDNELLFRALSNIGTCLFRQGKREFAAKRWKQGYEMNPTATKAKTNHALGLTCLRFFDEAELLLKDALALEPDAWDVVGITAVLYAERDGAAKCIEFLKGHPVDRKDFYILLANQLVRNASYEEALATITKAETFTGESSALSAVKANLLASSVIDKRSETSGPLLALTREEREKLLEAVNLLKRAIELFKSHGELIDLQIHVTNLSMFYAALGNFRTSAEAAEEAVALSASDDRPYLSLFYAQMQLGEHKKAVETARAICHLGHLREGMTRLLDALVWDRSYAKALEEFDTGLRTIPGFDSDSYICCLRARALFGLPDTMAALLYLDSVIERFPDDPLPLLQKAEFEAIQNHFERAQELYERAEALTTGEERVQIRQQVGFFWYHRQSWEKAITRFLPQGIDPLYSPFLNEILVCLFKLDRFAQCLALAKESIAKDGYNELTFSLSAYCYIHFRNLAEAIPLLKELVSRSNDIRYWMHLAQVYFRMDEPSEAEKLLFSAHESHPDSKEILLLLSNLLLRGGKGVQAIELAFKALKLDPDGLETNQAVVAAGITQNVEALQPEQISTVQKSLAFLTTHPESGVRAVPITTDLSAITEIVRNQTQSASSVVGKYNTEFRTLALLTKALHRSPYEIWNSLRLMTDQSIYVASGTPEEQQASFLNVSQATEIVLDITCLFSLQQVGLLNVLTTLFTRIHVPLAVFESIKSESDKLRLEPQASSFMSYQNGRLQLTEIPPEFREEQVRFIEGILNSLRTLPPAEGIDAEAEQIDQVAEWSTAFEPFHFDATLIAKTNSCCLIIDDLAIREVAVNTFQVKCTNTQFVLLLALNRNVITRDQYEDALLNLIESGYTFISESKETAIREITAHGYQITPLASKLLSRPSDQRYIPAASAKVIADIVLHFWHSEIDADKRSVIIKECAKNFNTEWAIEHSLNPFIIGLFLMLIYEPSTYYGITLQVFTGPPLSIQHQTTSLELVLRAARAFDRIFSTNGTWSAQMRQEWLENGEAARQLLNALQAYD